MTARAHTQVWVAVALAADYSNVFHDCLLIVSIPSANDTFRVGPYFGITVAAAGTGAGSAYAGRNRHDTKSESVMLFL